MLFLSTLLADRYVTLSFEFIYKLRAKNLYRRSPMQQRCRSPDRSSTARCTVSALWDFGDTKLTASSKIRCLHLHSLLLCYYLYTIFYSRRVLIDMAIRFLCNFVQLILIGTYTLNIKRLT